MVEDAVIYIQLAILYVLTFVELIIIHPMKTIKIFKTACFQKLTLGSESRSNLISLLFLILAVITLPAFAVTKKKPLKIQEQGSFAVGGTMITNPGTFNPYNPTPEGQTFRGDHAYVFYQIPVKARKYPLAMWHGIGQFSKTWETTPDGREGFQNIFLRRGFPVYLIDQPRRGNAGRSMAEGHHNSHTR